MRRIIGLVLCICTILPVLGQEGTIRMDAVASLDQVYGTSRQSATLLTMGDLDMESGYVLYETEIGSEAGGEVLLQVENVRDYAAVYLNGVYVGSLNAEKNTIPLNLPTGQSTLQLYVENIGRITYGPEILDNSRGIFGNVLLGGTSIRKWKITPLWIRDADVSKLQFVSKEKPATLPCFHRGLFSLDELKDVSLDIKGWGMGEVWVNGHYLGAYWEEEAIQTLRIRAADLKKGQNELILFDLKANDPGSVQLHML